MKVTCQPKNKQYPSSGLRTQRHFKHISLPQHFGRFYPNIEEMKNPKIHKNNNYVKREQRTEQKMFDVSFDTIRSNDLFFETVCDYIVL